MSPRQIILRGKYPKLILPCKHTGVEIKFGGMNFDKSSLPNRPTVLVKVLVNKYLFSDVDLISRVFGLSSSHHLNS